MDSAKIIEFTAGRERRAKPRTQPQAVTYEGAVWKEIEDHLWRSAHELRKAVDLFCAVRQAQEPP